MIRGARIEVVTSERGRFDASVTRVDLDKMWLQSGHESLARTFRGVTPANRLIVWFPNTPQPPAQMLTDMIEYENISILGSNLASAWRTSGVSHWASMSLPTDEFLRVGSALAGLDVRPRAVIRVLRPSAGARSRLGRLHAAVFKLAQGSPAMLGQPEARRGLEQCLVRTAFAAIADGETRGMVPAHRHRQVMARFETLLEDNSERALYIPEVCAAIGVSDRNLRYIFQDRLGMSPSQYLWLRRMHLARRALQSAAPSSTTVTDVATANGFFELGRFAVAYRRLFDESPTATLKRAADATGLIEIPLRTT